jgi:opacity protein-like surface antigen
MKPTVVAVVLAALLLLTAGSARAQKAEISLSIGALKSGDLNTSLGSIKAGTSFAYEVNVAVRLYNAHLAALYVEVPFAGTPKTTLTSSNPFSPSDYSSFFITPGLKLKVLPGAPFSPYAFAGAGYARFHEGSTLANGSQNPGSGGTGRGAFDFGGGVDWKVLPSISVRGEVRDFYSGTPKFNTSLLNDKQQNVLVSAGVVLRF